MKKMALFLAFFLVLKPIIPVLQYAIGYDYIVKVLCENREKPEMQCHGTCYLKSELARASKEESSSTEKKNSETSSTTLFYLVIESLCLLSLHDIKNKINTFYSNLYTYLNTFLVFHPPTICL